jgi:hypothetical protein
MKKLFFICVCFLFAITNCETLKEDEVVARKIMYRVSAVLESRYQLRYIVLPDLIKIRSQARFWI